MGRKKKSKLHRFYYTFHPFNIELYVIIAPTVVEAINYMLENCEPKIKEDPAEHKMTMGLFINDEISGYSILLSTEDLKPGRIAHECFHAIKRMSDSRGCWIEDSSEEFFTYSIERLVDTIWEEYTKNF